MSEIDPFSAEDARLMWHVLSRWLKILQGRSNSRMLNGLIKNSYSSIVTPEVLDLTIPKAATPIYSREWGWIIGAPLKRAEHVIPVATVTVGPEVGNQLTGLAIRVALLHERQDGTVFAEGWRFEQGEVENAENPEDLPAHPYAHAQAIIGWVKGSDCLLHPPHQPGDACNGIDLCSQDEVDIDRKAAQTLTLVKHPAFPLGMKTMTGLAMSVVATLYGATGVEDIMRGDNSLKSVVGAVYDDLSRLRVHA